MLTHFNINYKPYTNTQIINSNIIINYCIVLYRNTHTQTYPRTYINAPPAHQKNPSPPQPELPLLIIVWIVLIYLE